jgi:hypothetical protein
MSKPKRKAKADVEARVAEHAERSRAAMQRASSVRALRPPAEAEEPMGKGRKGRKGVVIYLSPEAKEQLARLAYDQRKSVQAIGTEAINLLFECYRLKPIA